MLKLQNKNLHCFKGHMLTVQITLFYVFFLNLDLRIIYRKREKTGIERNIIPF